MRRLISILALALLATSCSRWRTNEEYLDYLASIVIQYQNKHGSFPEHFSVAHEDSGIILPNRGDKNGNGLIYLRFEPNCFMFRSYGANNKDDKGEGDDLDIYYIGGKKVGRTIFKDYVSKNTDPLFWSIYRELFKNGNGA
jgi:hypothetical protein